jgi:hypothetical protein
MNTNMTPRSGPVTPEKDKGRDAHYSDPTPNANPHTEFRPLLDLKQHPARRTITHRLALLALQLLNDTVALGAVMMFLFALSKLVEVLL